jgi:predicted Zn-dependent protease
MMRNQKEGEMETDLDTLSNRALDAIEARRYAEAEKLCQQLLRDFPGAFDGHDRMGELREIQGRFREAAEHYSKMVEIVQGNPAGTDADTLTYCTDKRDRALAKVTK